MPEEGFPLPGSSYEELTKIIKAYGKHNAEADLSIISQLTGMHTTLISRNNGFLLAVGLIAGGKKKVITDRGRALARALEYEMPDDIKNSWRDVVLSSDFLQRLVSAVKIRKGMEISTLESHVAYSAGQSKTPSVMAGARAVVDILRAAGLIKESEGNLISASDEPQQSAPESSTMVSKKDEQPVAPLSPAPCLQPDIKKSTPGVAVTIQIQIQCTAAEVETLGPKIQSLLKDISKNAVGE